MSVIILILMCYAVFHNMILKSIGMLQFVQNVFSGDEQCQYRIRLVFQRLSLSLSSASDVMSDKFSVSLGHHSFMPY
jgi:hypothetical protein